MLATARPDQRGTWTGVARNIGAGAVEGAAGAMNILADPFGNIVGKPAAIVGERLYSTIAPLFGGKPMDAKAREYLFTDQQPQIGTRITEGIGRAVGASPADVEPHGGLEKYARLATQGALMGGALGGPVVAAAGAGGMMAGDVAGGMVSEPWEAAANLGGNLAAGPVAARGAQVVGRGINALGTRAGALGYGAKPIVDEAGAAVPGMEGQRATQTQLLRLGEKMRGAAGDDLPAVQTALEAPGSEVPGVRRTTAQQTQAPGMVDLESTYRRAYAPQFLGRDASNMEALQGGISGLKDEGAVSQAPGRMIAEHMRAIDDAAEGVQRGAPAIAGRTAALGGYSEPQGQGATMRQAVDTARGPAKAAASRPWQVLKEDKTLAVNLSPMFDMVRSLSTEASPTSASVPGMGMVLGHIANSVKNKRTLTFEQMSDLMRDTSAVERALRNDAMIGNESPAMRTLGQFKQSLYDSIAHTIDLTAAREAALIATGVMAPEASLAARLDEAAMRGAGQLAGGGRVSGAGVAQGAGAVPGGGRGGGGGADVPGIPARGGLGGASRAGGMEGYGQAQDALAFLISRGGLKPNGELRNFDAHIVRPGLVRKTGLEHDRAREALQEGGFRSPNTGRMDTLGDFYDVVDMNLRGHRQYGNDLPRQADDTRSRYMDSVKMDGAREEVNMLAGDLNLRMTPAEVEHAASLTLGGALPEAAIREAIAASDDAALQRNVQQQAFEGAPGVSPLANQSRIQMPEGGAAGGLQPNFPADAAAMYAQARPVYAKYKETYSTGPVGKILQPGPSPGSYKLADADAVRTIFDGSPRTPENVQKLIAAAGGADAVAPIAREVLAWQMRRRGVIGFDGMIDAAKFQAWARDNAATLEKFSGLKQEFADVGAAQVAYDATMAQVAQTKKDFQKSAAAYFLSRDPNYTAMEPAQSVAKAFRDGPQAMQAIDKLLRGNPDAAAGWKAAVTDYITARFSSARPANETTDYLKSGQFRDFIKQNRDSLKAVYGGQGLNLLEAIEGELRRASYRPEAGSGSPTTQYLIGAKGEGLMPESKGGQRTWLAILGERLGERAGHSLGAGEHGGTVAPVIGMTTIPWIVGKIGALHQNGIDSMNALVKEALLNPAFARVVMQKVPATAEVTPAVQRRLGAALVAGQAADRDDR